MVGNHHFLRYLKKKKKLDSCFPYETWLLSIRQRSNMIGFIAPAIGPNKCKRLTWYSTGAQFSLNEKQHAWLSQKITVRLVIFEPVLGFKRHLICIIELFWPSQNFLWFYTEPFNVRNTMWISEFCYLRVFQEFDTLAFPIGARRIMNI